MKLLLDTHIWIWLLQAPQHVGPHAAQALADPANELWLSAVSTWEVLTLHRKGRIRLPGNLSEWFTLALAGIRQRVPLTHEIVFAAHNLNLHDDPTDRFLAATAQVLDLTLVTADLRLLGLGNIRTLANR